MQALANKTPSFMLVCRKSGKADRAAKDFGGPGSVGSWDWRIVKQTPRLGDGPDSPFLRPNPMELARNYRLRAGRMLPWLGYAGVDAKFDQNS
jgi:hypothetical protein